MKLLGTALLATALALGVHPLAAAGPPAAAEPERRPNIVLIMTDDMTEYDLEYMPHTRAALAGGVEFSDFLSPNPLCCPARAEILSGQASHNNGVHYNANAWGSGNMVDPGNNLASWLKDAGYQTGLVGKFLNGVETTDAWGNGWSLLHFLLPDVVAAYDFIYYGMDSPVRDVYTTDYIGQQTNATVERYAGGKPFFIWSSHVAPHAMRAAPGEPFTTAIPHERHADWAPEGGWTAPPSMLKPSFNEADVSDKPSYLQQEPVSEKRTRYRFRQRIRSLQAVDEQVAALVETLKKTGELNSTVLMFTSDNGYLLGEHRLDQKNQPYEEALQVPFLMAGPGVPSGSTAKTATIVDIPATVVDLAEARAGRILDGVSLMPMLAGEPGYQRVLIQAGAPDRAWAWRGVRSNRWTYAEHYTGEVELYDRNSDPYQLANLAGSRPEVEARYADWLRQLRNCAGDTCH